MRNWSRRFDSDREDLFMLLDQNFSKIKFSPLKNVLVGPFLMFCNTIDGVNADET